MRTHTCTLMHAKPVPPSGLIIHKKKHIKVPVVLVIEMYSVYTHAGARHNTHLLYSYAGGQIKEGPLFSAFIGTYNYRWLSARALHVPGQQVV